MDNRCRIGKSSIHGTGGFANRFIPKGTVMSRVELALDASFQGFNHSCSHNLELESEAYLYNDVPMHLIAIKDILPGEEMTMFYPVKGGLEKIVREGGCHCQDCRRKR